MRASLIFVALLGGCLRSTSYSCSDNAQCGTNGTCEVTGFCSLPDTECNGNRYVDSAGQYAGQCVVGGTPIDAPKPPDIDAPDGPPPIDMAIPCEGFAALNGLANGHVYKAITMTRHWDQQVTACANLSPGHSYLAFPEDMAELTAITTESSPATWIGIHRTAPNTFETVKMTVPPYTPWQGGNPDTNPSKDCVNAVSATEIQMEACNQQLHALCECEP